MSLADSILDGHVSLVYHLSRSIAGWDDLDRGWQAVLLGLAVTACVTVGLQIPW